MRALQNNNVRLFPLLTLLLLVLTLSGCSAIGASMKATPTMIHWGGLMSMEMDDLKERYTNEYSKFVQVNGYNIHYQDRGQGETIILMHGIFSALQTWDEWIEELSKTHRVIALDMPGYGLTGGPPNLDDFNEEHALAAFEQFVNKLDLDRVSLAGNSLGGYIAARYAARNPGRVNRLILLDPFGYPQDTPWILSLGTFAPIAFMGQYIQPAWIVTLNVAWVYGDSDRIDEEDYFRYVHMNQRPGAKPLYIKTLKMIEARAENFDPPPFQSITAETLLMWGEDDAWVPLELAEKWMTDIDQSQLIIYPTAGHVPMEELPEETVADAALFLRQGLNGVADRVISLEEALKED